MAKLTDDDKINIVIKYEAGVKTSKKQMNTELMYLVLNALCIDTENME